MSQNILVFIEQRGGQIRKSSLEALSEARRQAKASSSQTLAVVIGSNIKALAAQLHKYKPNKVVIIDSPAYANYSTEGYAQALAEAIKKESPGYVFAAHTSMAKDLIPRVATRLDAPLASDVVELKNEAGKILAVRPLYSGKVYGIVEFTSTQAFLTLRPNRFEAAESTNGGDVAQEDFTPEEANIRAKVTETHAATGSKVELSEAPIIVSGGRGIKGPENWAMLQDLCDVLGAALGASRAVVDAGWIDHQHQVGQTGKTVSPQLYIACGISGAIQHLAGMSSSKVIVAINKDADAPIFKSATYGLVGDVFEIVPKVTEELRKLNLGN